MLFDKATCSGIGCPTPLTAFNTGGSPNSTPDAGTPENTNEPSLVWLQGVLAQSDAEIPQVVSTSHAHHKQTVPPAYARSVCAQLVQLGAGEGVSLLLPAVMTTLAQAVPALRTMARTHGLFLPAFPASCPFVTLSVSPRASVPN